MWVGKLAIFNRFLDICLNIWLFYSKNCGEKKLSNSVSGYFKTKQKKKKKVTTATKPRGVGVKALGH